ncbi:ion channel [Seonamhaeicola marinus]|uniref:Ion transporter n=1 Tax=Seonamhaeicola marinus TaxID=1912246 RepID=A0A5D0HJS7_9FLAO|nr:ion channel [Seonamhaeicola marinus]TYA71495.1 ion transporter [Seonamhaeicola marinus]
MGEKIKDPGLGNASAPFAERMMNPNGSFNIIHLNKTRRFSEAYNFLVSISWGYFFFLTFLMGLLINAFFALVYLVIGIEEITASTGNLLNDFLNAFFFSAQTFTTLGYGAMAPNGVLSGIISSFEAFLGLVIFAFVTGLLYGRFSKPKAAIRFSEHIVLRDFKHTKAIMFRIVNNRKSVMIYPKVAVTLSLTKQNNLGHFVNEFYNLPLERKSINYLPTTWTIVHEIDKDSPLFEFSKEELKEQTGELLIMISYYDESFNQEIHQMHSYTLNELHLDYKFTRAYYYNEKGKMVLDHRLFDCVEKLKS